MSPVPDRLQRNPVWRGFPVPYIALIGANGEPDFRVICAEKRLDVARFQLCQLCGEKLGRAKFFAGGPKCAAQMIYFEPPCHLECLTFAMQSCPFILGRKEHDEVATVIADHAGTPVCVRPDSTFTTVRDPQWKIVKASDYNIIPGQQEGEWFFQPVPVRWISPALYPERMDAEAWAILTDQLYHA